MLHHERMSEVAITQRERIGRYEVVGRLALGGMAEILLARLTGPKGFERPVVIKRILPHLAEQKQFVEMMADEARIAAQIHHPNVVQIYELLEENDQPYIVMEYLQGESMFGLFRRAIQAKEHIHQALCAHVIAQAAAGLHAAHELKDDEGATVGVVHRDISPQNIFVNYDGSVKVLDFGIAKAAERFTQTHTGQLKGKFHYMSPEQAQALPLDRRTDVFSLGIVLHEALTLRKLFKRDNELLTMKAIVEKEQHPPSKIRSDVTPALDRICAKALAKNPDDRYQDCAEMQRELAMTVRRLLPDALPQNALSKLMHEHFDTRAAEKSQMLRKLQSSASVTIPLAEVDLDVELPSASDVSRSQVVMAAEIAPPSLQTRARTAPILAGVVALLVLAIGIVLMTREEEAPDTLVANAQTPVTEPVAMVEDPVEEPVIEEPAMVEEPTMEPVMAALPASVPIEVRTNPPGATVKVGDEERGVTPVRLMVDRSEEMQTLVVELAGYHPYVLEMTPDVAQRHSLQLVRERRAPRMSAMSSMSMSTMMTSGFHRFD